MVKQVHYGVSIAAGRNSSIGYGRQDVQQTAKHILFSGQVQGVGFRYTANRIARRYNLTGFVRNLPDGDVEMLAQGPERDIDTCIAEIQDDFAGYIRDTQIKPAAHNPRHTDFRITF
jgi:acylphosphatase